MFYVYFFPAFFIGHELLPPSISHAKNYAAFSNSHKEHSSFWLSFTILCKTSTGIFFGIFFYINFIFHSHCFHGDESICCFYFLLAGFLLRISFILRWIPFSSLNMISGFLCDFGNLIVMFLEKIRRDWKIFAGGLRF